jgi:hypothetical protein
VRGLGGITPKGIYKYMFLFLPLVKSLGGKFQGIYSLLYTLCLFIEHHSAYDNDNTLYCY